MTECGSRELILVAQDRGGADAVVGVWQALQKQGWEAVEGWARGPAREVFARAGVPLRGVPDASDADRWVEDRLRRLAPSAVLCGTSLGSSPEKAAVRGARTARVPSVGVLDAWVNYRQRFESPRIDPWLRNLPDRILVMDEVAADDCVAAGIPRDRIRVTGHPSYDFLCVDGATSRMGRAGAPPRQVAFFSQPIATLKRAGVAFGMTEVEAIRLLAQAISRLPPAQRPAVVVRPHPKESVSRWRRLLSEILPTARLDSTPHYMSTLRDTDLALGISTMVLFAGYLSGVPVAALQRETEGRDSLILTRLGLISCTDDPDELAGLLREGPALVDRSAVPLLAWCDGHAAERAAREVAEMARRPTRLDPAGGQQP